MSEVVKAILPLLLCLVAQGSRFDPSTVKPLGRPLDRILDVSELVEMHGYLARRYEARTEDGYLLGVTRLGNRTGPPVLFVNGLSLGPQLWVLHGSGHDLPFVMSDLGYDVWIGGQRGIRGSLGHTYLDYATQPEYWDFSHDESGMFDLPAMIDLMTEVTGHNEVFYVGTSLGGTFFMAMCETRPQHCTKFMKRADGKADMLTDPSFAEGLLLVCDKVVDFCFYLLNEVTGFQKKNMAEGWLGVSLAHSSAGTSVRQMDHLLQLTSNGGLSMYDFGIIENKARYGSINPPTYNLSNWISPTVVFYSENDILIPKKIMLEAVKSIGNLQYARPIPDETYGHSEFVFGKDLYKLVFADVIDFFDSLSGLK